MTNKENNDFSQSENSIRKNTEFFRDNISAYNKKVGELDTYQRIFNVVTAEVAGITNLLDLGNGGVFDYDTSVVKNITGLDLFLDQLPADRKYPENVKLEAGDALNISKEDETYDGVLMVMLLHHLIGKNVAGCRANLQRAISEAARVLKPGGKLVIVESCVPNWFFQLEKLGYTLSVPVVNALLTHPPAFQFTADEILNCLEANTGGVVKSLPIPKEKYVMQFGFKVPSYLTPVQPYVFVTHKA